MPRNQLRRNRRMPSANGNPTRDLWWKRVGRGSRCALPRPHTLPVSDAGKDRQNPGSSVPSGRSTCLFGYIFQALARTFRYQAKLRLTTRNQGGMYGTKRGLLLRNPMQSVERNHKIEFVLEGQTSSIGDEKSKVGQGCRTKVALGEANHVS